MKQSNFIHRFRRKLAALATGGILLQISLSSCQFDQITATSTVTLDGREVLINLIRGAILTPIDQFITDRENSLIEELSSE